MDQASGDKIVTGLLDNINDLPSTRYLAVIMKRSVSSDSSETKRAKICPGSSPTSLDHAPEQSPLDILRHGVDQAGCILGSFLMMWNHEKEIGGIASIRSSSQEIHKFQIFFNTSEDSLTALNLLPHDEFRLSLYGAEMEKLAQVPKISTLALKLVYRQGVHIEWKPRGSDQMKSVNTWLCTLFFIAMLLVPIV